ncbi:phage holin family protein [Flaviaesturariibacter amylovorans]|uniref:Phage holin family protein n=1 Tax=Flaviaesturariibacter amylovorans TaxID=1084520 RepID=A0ABP8HUA2_9BACT
MNFLLRFVLSALAGYGMILYLLSTDVRDRAAALLAACFIAMVNSFVRPRAIVRRQPITVFTLSLIMIAINYGLLYLCDRYIPGFAIRTWWHGLAIAAVITAVNFSIDRFVQTKKD